MPPNSQPQTTSILQPGNRVVTNAAGLITNFGDFAINSDAEAARTQTGVCIGVYAAGGTGKTTFFCSICDPKLNPDKHDLPLLMLDAEGGVKSVANFVGTDFQYITIKTFYDVENWINVARAQPRSQFPWKSVYLDNLSDMVQKALYEQGLHGDTVKGGGATRTSSQGDYGAMTTRVTKTLQDLRDLATDYGFNLFISLWEQAEKDALGTIIGYRADITPKLASRVQGILDYIGYMTILKTPVAINGKLVWVRKLDFSPNPEPDSKWRVTQDHADEVPFELYQPTLPAILDTIKRDKPFPRARFVKPTSGINK